MKKYLLELALVAGLVALCGIDASAQTRNPDLPPTTTITTDNGWQLLLPIKKKACVDCPYFYGLVESETRDTSFMSYPPNYEVWVRPGWKTYGSIGTYPVYDIYVKDVGITSTDTVYMAQESASLTHNMCAGCWQIFQPQESELARSPLIINRIRYMTNVAELQGGMFLTNDPRFASADAYTVQFIKR